MIIFNGGFMKKFTFILSFVAVMFVFSVPSLAVSISAKRAIIIECQSGDIIYEKNAYEKAPMASTTKIMTALVAIENADLDKKILIDERFVNIEGSSIYLRVGEILTVREMLYALMLESANDVATALAYTVGGSIEGFAEMMNKKAREIGAYSTSFKNPHGLDDDEHYTTAYDLAKIAAYAMENPVFREIVSTKSITILKNTDYPRLLVNHNKLLRGYSGAIGIKTGFTKKCGRCLVSCAEVDGVRLVAVTLDAPSDWNDHRELLDYGFTQYENIVLAEPNDYNLSLNVVNGKKSSVLCSNGNMLSVTLKKGLKNDIRAVFECEHFLYAPVKRGDLVGKIVYYLDKKEIASLPIYATEDSDAIKYKKSIFERIFS